MSVNANNTFEGVYILKGVFSPLDLQGAMEDGSTDTDVITDNPDISSLFANPRVRNAVETIAGANLPLFQVCNETCIPNEDKRAWTVGLPYAKCNSNNQYKQQVNGVRAIVPLSSFTIENGATMWVPNSHLSRFFPTNERLLKGSFADADDEVRVFPCKKKILTCDIGDVIIFPANVWHSRGLNTTASPRKAIVADFVRK